MTELQAAQKNPVYGQLFLSIRRLSVLMHALSSKEKALLDDLIIKERIMRSQIEKDS